MSDDVMQLGDLASDVRSALETCMQLRMEAKELEDTAAGKKETANQIVAALFEKHQLTAVADQSGNTLRKKTTTRTTLNQDELRKVLVTDYDLGEDDILHIMSASSKTSTSTSYEFRLAK